MKIFIFLLVFFLLLNCSKNKYENNTLLENIDVYKDYTYEQYKSLIYSINKRKPYPNINDIPNENE
tara:strand:+ start:230 stop:427 length:198 start_codon:yes stop_codon:yes gene_type:complete